MPFKKAVDPSVAYKGFTLSFSRLPVQTEKTYQVVVTEISKIPKRTNIAINPRNQTVMSDGEFFGYQCIC